MTIFFVLSGISVLLILLGFIALLTQKIYIDSRTNTLTEVEIPLFGKMKTNFPALIFVFFGCVLIFFAVEKFNEKVPWLITGSLQNVGENDIDWSKGSVSLFPCDIDNPEIGEKGNFRILAKIEKGKTFEDIIERVHFDHPDGASYVLFPGKEYKKHSKRPLESLLEEYTYRTRLYKPLPVEYK